ncbi:hypothetical protein N0V83_001057 [Neocucurbitaria cava]|uniref:Uncharacterized protein n=1 Tax=Neocucurbitaria cava TaxID=798079 RepID=A0A9W8YEL6_9PLEO|nr:hypothetical protein N0V83_001057 [Neocucurbitaria cava]
MPGSKPPTFAISDRYGPSIDPKLMPLARDLFSFDLELLRRVERKHASSSDEIRKNRAVPRVEEIFEIRQQWQDIELCRSQFSQSYVQDKLFIPVWVEGLRIVKEALRNNHVSGNHMKQRCDYMNILARYEKLACRLRDRLVDTARQGLLTNEVLMSTQERWIRLDGLLDEYHDTYNDHRDEDTSFAPRIAPKWSVQDCKMRMETLIYVIGKKFDA